MRAPCPIPTWTRLALADLRKAVRKREQEALALDGLALILREL